MKSVHAVAGLYGDTEIAVVIYATRKKLRGGMNF